MRRAAAATNLPGSPPSRSPVATVPEPIQAACACRCCGLVQTLPATTASWRPARLAPGTVAPANLTSANFVPACARCRTALLRKASNARSASRTAALALAALILYPAAVTLPLLTIQHLGHSHQASILGGIASLLADGQAALAAIVLLCSIVFPLFKLLSLLVLTGGHSFNLLAQRHRALTWRIIEYTGRWGMLDVLLAAVLVAALKLGNWIDVTPGPAAVAFAACVILSLLAAASFDPRALWSDAE